MPVITQTQLENAARDADDLAAIVNGAVDRPNPGNPDGTVTTRLGEVVPTIASVMATAAEAIQLEGYTLFPVGHPAALDRILLVRLYGADPTKFYSVQQFFYKDVGARFRLTIVQSDDAAMAGEVAVCELQVPSGAAFAGRELLELAAIGGSGISGTVVANFGDGNTAFSLYSASADYSNAGLPIGVVIPNVDVSDQIEAVLATEAEREGRRTFQPYVRNEWLEDRILAIGIEGADPGHQYIVSQAWFEYYPTAGVGGTPLYRWKVRVRDVTLGIDCCEYGGSSGTNPSLTPGLLPEWGYMYQGTIAAFTGMTGLVKINWPLIDWTVATQRNYTLPSEAGVAPHNCHTNDQMDSFLIESNPQLVLTVGAAGDFPTVKAANDSLLRYGLVQNNQSTTLPWSDICSYTRQVLIQIIDDNYREDLNELIMPPYLTIRGKGIDNTIFSHTSPDTTERLAEYRHSGCVEDCTWVQKGPAYIIHSDAFNDWSGAAATGPAIQRFRIRKIMRRVKLVTEATTGNAWGWGSGISSWEYQLFEDCQLVRPNVVNTSAIIGIHSCPNMTRAATVHFRRCTTDSFFNNEVVLLSGFAQNQLNRCIVEGGDLRLIRLASSFGLTASDMPTKARQRVAWEGMGDGALFDLTDAYMEVIQLPAGATIGGTLANTLLGTGYDQKHGRGEILIMEENPYRKLGAILGDRTGAPGTLTVNGVTHTFNLNYTAMSEADILASIAAGPLGAGVVSIVNLAQFIVPPGQRRTMQAAVAIDPKRFVNYAADKAELANGRPDGFTIEKMAINGVDTIFEERRFAASMIPELAAYEGEFKIVNGVATATAANDPLSVGEVYNNLVTLYD